MKKRRINIFEEKKDCKCTVNGREIQGEGNSEKGGKEAFRGKRRREVQGRRRRRLLGKKEKSDPRERREMESKGGRKRGIQGKEEN